MAKSSANCPATFNIAKWYGYVFAGFYLVYGGVTLILDFMDHTYENVERSLIALLIGIIVLIIVYAYRDLKTWGWYGMLTVHGLVVVYMLFTISQLTSVILLTLSGATVVLLLLPSTKECVFGSR